MPTTAPTTIFAAITVATPGLAVNTLVIDNGSALAPAFVVFASVPSKHNLIYTSLAKLATRAFSPQNPPSRYNHPTLSLYHKKIRSYLVQVPYMMEKTEIQYQRRMESKENTAETGSETQQNEPDVLVNDTVALEDDVIEILSSDDEDDIQVISTRQSATPVIDLDADTSNDHDDDRDVEITGSSRNGSERRLLQDDDDIQIVDERPLLGPQQRVHVHYNQAPGRFQAVLHTPVGEMQTNEFIRQMRSSHPPIPSHLASARRIGTRRAVRHNDSYVPHQWLINRLNQTLAENNLHFFHDADFLAREDAEHDMNVVENSIMQRIERDNELALDTRLANEKVFNRKALEEKKLTSEKELPGYVNDIDSNHEVCCELCGIILGEGIDPDFKPDPRYNQDLEKHMQMYRVHAPWFCIRQCTQADVDLSKRIFTAKCGHVFCGRCVRNIGNRPRKTKATATSVSIDNPDYYCPRKCPAPECGKRFSAKGFKEAYF